MLAAACKVTVPMATAEILLDFLLIEGEADGGGTGGGLTGTAAAAACSLSSLRAASLPFANTGNMFFFLSLFGSRNRLPLSPRSRRVSGRP
jgi:hypothetical protein